MSLSRRAFLAGAAVAPLGRAFAFGATTRVDIAELQLSRGTLSRPEGWKRLLHEVIQTTSVEADPSVVQLDPEDPALFGHPFAVLVGNDALPALSERAVQQLVRYLAYGGFLFLDDATGAAQSPFDRSVRALVARLFPTRPLGILGSDHSVYRSFFLLREPVGRLATHRVLEGVPHTTTHPLLYGRDDLSGALDRRPDGSEVMPCSPGGEAQRREAVKLGVNLVLYALTSNYKKDATHVNELLRDGRLE